jgi:hypothetical protein
MAAQSKIEDFMLHLVRNAFRRVLNTRFLEEKKNRF